MTGFVRSLHLKQLEASRDEAMSKKYSQSICDELSAAGEFLANGFKYFVNVEYDYKNRIWKSLGLEIKKYQSFDTITR